MPASKNPDTYPAFFTTIALSLPEGESETLRLHSLRDAKRLQYQWAYWRAAMRFHYEVGPGTGGRRPYAHILLRAEGITTTTAETAEGALLKFYWRGRSKEDLVLAEQLRFKEPLIAELPERSEQGTLAEQDTLAEGGLNTVLSKLGYTSGDASEDEDESSKD